MNIIHRMHHPHSCVEGGMSSSGMVRGLRESGLAFSGGTRTGFNEICGYHDRTAGSGLKEGEDREDAAAAVG